MKIAVACGGTGGHLFPGLATAVALQKRGHDVTLWLVGRRVETSSLEGWRGEVTHIPVAGAAGTSLWGRLRFCASLAVGVVKAFFEHRRRHTDVILCMGSYASVAPCLAARCLGLPIVLHEANAEPGRANLFLSRVADAVAVSFDKALSRFQNVETTVTGFPLRDAFLSLPERMPRTGILSVLVFGGSQGSRVLNQRVPSAMGLLQKDFDGSLHVVHLTGAETDVDAVQHAYRDLKVQADVQAFSQDMLSLYMGADVAIARAGAATCAELARTGVPAVLVPLPHAIHDHQTRNAEAMADDARFLMLPESDLTPECLARDVQVLIKNAPDHLGDRKRPRDNTMEDGTDRLADLVEKTGHKNKKTTRH